MKNKLDTSTLQEKVTFTLRQHILQQKYQSGDRLIQEDLAVALGVSRMPIREALFRLEMEGLVEMVPHKGAVVKNISKQDIEEIYYLRANLEGVAAAKSLNHLSPEDVMKLEELVEQMETDVGEQAIEQFTMHNGQFHQLLRKGCEWKRIHMIIEQLSMGYPFYFPSLFPETIEKSQQEHKAILQSVKDKDPVKLRQLMELHISRTGEILLSMFK